MDIYFLHHSGIMLDDGQRCLVFDYYQDPKGLVDKLNGQGRELWFFVSHLHGDHFNREITRFDAPGTRYIIHEDVPLQGIDPAKVFAMKVCDLLDLDGVRITMYGSTDEGGSFLLDNGKERIFYAGDLNWWHWLGDTEENNRFAWDYAQKEFARLDGLTVDYAFFPVDARLEGAREWGVIEFLRHMTVRRLLVPIHANGPAWQPSVYFKALYGDLPLWIPTADGEMRAEHE